jgi:hypothetical protein
MSMARTVLTVWLCARLAGVCWGQGPSGSLEFLSEGIAAYQDGQWQLCVDSLEKAVAQGFDNPLYRLDALVCLGRAHARLGHEERTLTYFREALRQQPDYRPDAADTAGLELFATLLGADQKSHEQTPGRDGLPVVKIVTWGASVVSIAVILLLRGGGAGSESEPDRASIEGVVDLP